MVDEGIQAPSSSIVEQGTTDANSKYGVGGYFLLNFLSIGIATGNTISLWSSIGYGEALLGFFKEHDSWRFLAACCSASILCVLYLLDFFWPPHLQGQLFLLWDGDRYVGKVCFIVAVLVFFFSCCLLVRTYPSVPMVVSLVFQLAPAGAVLVRVCTGLSEDDKGGTRISWIIDNGDVGAKMKLLKRIVGHEQDLLHYYQGATAAFASCGLISLIVWLIFTGVNGGPKSATVKLDSGTMAILWITPLVASVADFVFSLMGLLRVSMHQSYRATNEYISRLNESGVTFALHDEMMEYKVTMHKARTSKIEVFEDVPEPELKTDEHHKQHAQYIAQLSKIVKIVVCIFVLLSGFLYVSMLLLYVDKKISSMILGILAVFFLSFVVFIYVAFKRIVEAMERWVADLPMWRSAMDMLQEPVLLAMFFAPLSITLPFILALSWTNQQVRKIRGLYHRVPHSAQGQMYGCETPEALMVTPRINGILVYLSSWGWEKVLSWTYIWCLVFFAVYVTPTFLNVTLARLRLVFATRKYEEIVGAVFVTGVVAFLLPPVPGLTVYVFGGLLLSDEKTCPYGFWGGALINIGVSFVLKLTACAIQQKLIGENFGNNMYVRSMVGVHKLQIRCIEAELRKKGWPLGKVAILCGGPDWPVSVLAGVLKLSLFQCELGTCPIIFFIIPCALSGSFYLKKGSSQIWTTLSSLMVASTLVVTAILWMIVAWALQQQLETNREELSRPLEQNVDLEWIDYRNSKVADKCGIPWGSLPSSVRVLYILGAATHILVCQSLFWASSYIFGSFEVQDHFKTLVWYRSGTFLVKKGVKGEPLLSIMAIFLLTVYVLAWAGYVQINTYRSSKTRLARMDALKDLSTQEAQWKKDYLESCSGFKIQAAAESSTGQQKDATELATEILPSQARVASEEKVLVEGEIPEEPPSPPSESANQTPPQVVSKVVSTSTPGEEAISGMTFPWICCMQDRSNQSPREAY